MLTPQQRTHLRDLVAQHFSTDELKAFCFEFGLDAEELVPANVVKSVAVRAIILWLENRQQLDLLLGWARRERPHADWGDLASLPTPSYDQFDRHTSPLPRMGVLWAAPLIYEKDGQRHPIDLLNMQQERQRLHDSLDEAGRASGHAVCVREMSATVPNLQKLLSIGCQILHYSGHGAPDFLAFEGEAGMAHALSADALRQLLQAAGAAVPKLAFVSACHSRVAGEAFAAAGVAHVVAVRVEQAVLDEAASVFARQFYLALLMGQTVRQAFEVGRQAVAHDARLGEWGVAQYERDKFLLLPEQADHAQAILANGLRGQWRDDSPPPAPMLGDWRWPEVFVGRSDELQQAVAQVLTHRLTVVTGAPGIGKTTLCQKAAEYVVQRTDGARGFKDGAVFVPLRGVESAEALVSALALALDPANPAQNEAQLWASLRGKAMLLLLDNAEDPIYSAQTAVRDLIDKLLRNRDTHILMATRMPPALPRGVQMHLLELNRLGPSAALDLFVQLSPAALRHQLYQPEQVATLTQLLGYLAGHPFAIELAAKQAARQGLAQLAQAIASQKTAALKDPYLRGRDAIEQDTLSSMIAALNVSRTHARDLHPDAERLFGLFGLLPGGAAAPLLDAACQDLAWRDPVQVLVDVSLLQYQPDAQRYSTFPFVTDYAHDRCLQPADAALWDQRIGEWLSAVCRLLYDKIGRQDGVSFGQTAAFLGYELPNIRAELTRAKTISLIGMLGGVTSELLQLVSRYNDGLHLASLTRSICQNIGDRVGEANVTKVIGTLKVWKDDLLGARTDYELALSIYQEIGSKGDPVISSGEANVLVALGDLKVRESDLVGGHRDYVRALSIYASIRDDMGEVSVLQSLGDLKVRLADFKGARVDYEKALKTCYSIKYKLGAAHLWHSLGDLKIRSADLLGARKNYIQALSLCDEIEDKLGKANILLAMGELKVLKSDLKGAESDYKVALQIYREIDHKLGEANVLLKWGDLKVRIDNFAEAQNNYDLALEVYRIIRFRLGEANAHFSRGNLNLRMAYLKDAQTDFDLALLLYRSIKDKLGEANVMRSLGVVAKKRKEYTKALDFCAHAAKIHSQISVAIAVGADLLEMGRIAQMAKLYVQSMGWAEQSLEIYRDLDQSWGQALALEDQAKALLQLEAYDAAIAACWQAAALFQAIGDERNAGRILGILQNIQSQVPPDVWAQLLAAVQADAEGLRSAAVAAILAQAG